MGAGMKRASNYSGIEEERGLLLAEGNGHRRGHRTEVEEDWPLGSTCQRVRER
jgi:hypothetical protein